jgi:ferredoxin-NADP reductase
MEEYIVKILSITEATHDVRVIRTEKPAGYSFTPGQATEVSINTSGWKNEKRPFTFTGLNSDPYLEFTIKTYPSHHGLTEKLLLIKPGSELIIRDVWGAIQYKGKGVFIAGGAGITPFLSIFRDLNSRNEAGGNLLIFANKKREDIISEIELRKLLGKNFVNILSDEKADGYYYGFITKSFLESIITDINITFYVCGPPPMMESVLKQLAGLGVANNSITLEL